MHMQQRPWAVVRHLQGTYRARQHRAASRAGVQTTMTTSATQALSLQAAHLPTTTLIACALLLRYHHISRQAVAVGAGPAHLLVVLQAVLALLLTGSLAHCRVHCRQQSSSVLAEAEALGLRQGWRSATRLRNILQF
jgi:hypothetical protein